MNPIFLLGAAAFGLYWLDKNKKDQADAPVPPQNIAGGVLTPSLGFNKAQFQPKAELAVIPNPCFSRVKRSNNSQASDLIPGA
jgi:hypothetical protein